ncbi:hypothetical protein PVAND_001848 [Polypedilum vanderplanki]|uniref:Uncharacterized protein n=1 Tax=Polypedilum vanderplanki TaxID=319348 RepID=A0A9J6BPG4_POLVA|nr:hypothetical protein PVAND_001848 [Polypedilum vanderplanki]
MQDDKKVCDCKGKRTCLLCEGLFNKKAKDWLTEYKGLDSYVYCPSCKQIFKGWQAVLNCDEHELSSNGRKFSGLYLQQDFLTNSECSKIVHNVDESLWDLSQSGRRKKNFGPKVNFKKKKLRPEFFQGFFSSSDFIREKLNKVDFLKDFKIVEECFLEYEESRGSHIEPHLDDCWIWGERIVTVNCIGDTVLTLTKHFPTYAQQYNLDCLELYKSELIGELEDIVPDNIVIRVKMPARSLFVLYGAPRYQYEHSVLREDITNRRVCIAYREFTKQYTDFNKLFD